MKMRIPNSIITYCVKALSQSMDNRTMTMVARRLLPGYDLHARTGIPESVAVPNQNAARQIVGDIIQCNMFLEFVLLLMTFSGQGNSKGIAGRKISIPYMRPIITGIYKMGYIYDPRNHLFMENHNERKTKNWGTLKSGSEYTLAFLRIDIAGNSRMVKKNKSSDIEQSYLQLRDIFINSVEKRNGRVWGWDGDGGIAAFCFGNMNECAVLSAIEVLHNLFIFNHTACQLNERIKTRMAVHSGIFEYTDDSEEMLHAETVKKTIDIEHNHTCSDSITVSHAVKVMLEILTSKQFTEFKSSDKRTYYEYKIRMQNLE